MEAPDEELARIRARKLEELRRAVDRPRPPPRPVALDEGSFAGFVRHHPLALVDFWATWCGPCRMMEPILDGLAAEGAVAVGKVDVDAQPGLAGAFEVGSIPTMLLFRSGQLADRLVGAMPASALRARLRA